MSWAATFLNFYMFPTDSFSCPGLMSPPTYSLKSAPVMTVRSPGVCFQSCGRIPASLAMALAVSGLSPVIILTVTPASLHCLTARGI